MQDQQFFESGSLLVLLSNFSAKRKSYFSIIWLVFWDLITNHLVYLATISVNTSILSVKCSQFTHFLKKCLLLSYPGKLFFVILVGCFLTTCFPAISREYLLSFFKMWALNDIKVVLFFCDAFSILTHFGSESSPLHLFHS